MTRCPEHGNQIQQTPSRAVNLFGAPLNQIVVGQWAEQDLRLVDFTGPALALKVCQHWARWLHGAPERPDGVIYPSRLFPGSRNLAVFERCSIHWQETPLGNLLSLPDASGQPIVYQILDDQGWGLVD